MSVSHSEANAQLLKWNLFIDNNLLIRVGGRIQNSLDLVTINIILFCYILNIILQFYCLNTNTFE